MTGERLARIDAIQRKLEHLRGLDDAQATDVILASGGPLAPIDGVLDDLTAVFSLFSVLQGSCLRFVRPESIVTPEAWAERRDDPGCPLGNPFDIGYKHLGMPNDIPDFLGEPVIRVDREDGGVYYLNGDDYAFYYANPDQIETWEFDVGVIEFFDDFVLGARYPELMEVVIGKELYDRRDRKGRYVDTWRTLLEHGALL
jgi:hypothetical protein